MIIYSWALPAALRLTLALSVSPDARIACVSAYAEPVVTQYTCKLVHAKSGMKTVCQPWHALAREPWRCGFACVLFIDEIV